MTLHEDWHKAHPDHPCEYDTCPRGQVLDLENATYTAAEVKVLTEAALRLGRKEAGEEIAAAIEARSLPGPERDWDAAIARSIGSQPSPDATTAPSEAGGYSDLPQDSQAGRRSPQGDANG